MGRLLSRACHIYTPGFNAAATVRQRRCMSTEVRNGIVVETAKQIMSMANAHRPNTVTRYYTPFDDDAKNEKAIAEEMLGGTVLWPSIDSMSDDVEAARLAELVKIVKRKPASYNCVDSGRDYEDCIPSKRIKRQCVARPARQQQAASAGSNSDVHQDQRVDDGDVAD